MIRPVTIWYRWDEQERQWKHNHFEIGLRRNANLPAPTSPQQIKVWPRQRWAKKYGYYQKAVGTSRLVPESELVECEYKQRLSNYE